MRQLRRDLMRLSLLAGVAALAAGCGSTDPAPPVATVSFAANKPKVPVGSPVELTYKFDVAPDAKISGDYRVFVHVKNPDGTTLWNDDHDPSIPTSKWTPGQTIQYTRTRFVPAGPYSGEATVELGLYRDTDRLPLQGREPTDRESTSRSYRVGTLTLLPLSENIFVILNSGWHPAEFSPEDSTLEWQWTQKVATLRFRNPRKDINFYIEYDARPDIFSDRPQQVTVYSGEQAVATFAAEQSNPTLKIFPITQAQLGGSEMAELRLEVDRTFVPAKLPSGGRDARELGIRVYHAFVEGR
jgi:hypothetical protein